MEKDDNLLNDFAREQWENAQSHLNSNYSLTPDECSEVFARAMVALYDRIRWGGMRQQELSLSSMLADIVDDKAHEFLKRMRRDVPAGNNEPNVILLPPPLPPQASEHMAQQPMAPPVAKKRHRLVPILVAVSAVVLLSVVAIAFFTMLKRDIQKYQQDIEEKIASGDEICDSPYIYDWESDSINVAISNELDSLLAEVEAGKNVKANIAKLDALWEESNANRNSNYAYFTPEIGYVLACAYKQDNNIKEAKITARKVMSIEPAGTDWGDKVRKLLEELKKIKEPQ